MEATPEQSRSGWCPVCAATAALYDVHAARRAGVEPAIVYDWIESGHLHVGETADGFVGVCLESLRARIEVT